MLVQNRTLETSLFHLLGSHNRAMFTFSRVLVYLLDSSVNSNQSFKCNTTSTSASWICWVNLLLDLFLKFYFSIFEEECSWPALYDTDWWLDSPSSNCCICNTTIHRQSMLLTIENINITDRIMIHTNQLDWFELAMLVHHLVLQTDILNQTVQKLPLVPRELRALTEIKYTLALHSF